MALNPQQLASRVAEDWLQLMDEVDKLRTIIAVE